MLIHFDRHAHAFWLACSYAMIGMLKHCDWHAHTLWLVCAYIFVGMLIHSGWHAHTFSLACSCIVIARNNSKTLSRSLCFSPSVSLSLSLSLLGSFSPRGFCWDISRFFSRRGTSITHVHASLLFFYFVVDTVHFRGVPRALPRRVVDARSFRQAVRSLYYCASACIQRLLPKAAGLLRLFICQEQTV